MKGILILGLFFYLAGYGQSVHSSQDINSVERNQIKQTLTEQSAQLKELNQKMDQILFYTADGQPGLITKVKLNTEFRASLENMFWIVVAAIVGQLAGMVYLFYDNSKVKKAATES